MFIPNLVENNIKGIVKLNLKECHDLKMKYYSFIFNVGCFLFITVIICSILYYKHKGHKNIKERKMKENEKRDYILYNLRKFQNIKNKHMTNIPFD